MPGLDGSEVPVRTEAVSCDHPVQGKNWLQEIKLDSWGCYPRPLLWSRVFQNNPPVRL